MGIVVHDVDRPDVGGVPPKMKAICDKCRESLTAPFLNIHTDDNIMSSVTIKGAFQPREQWSGGIWQNSEYFYFSVMPMNEKRYYEPTDPKITVELANVSHRIARKFRKYTGPVDKVIAKIREWIEAAADTSQWGAE